MRMSGRGSLTGNFIWRVTFDSDGRNHARKNGGRIRIEISFPFPSAAKVGLILFNSKRVVSICYYSVRVPYFFN